MYLMLFWVILVFRGIFVVVVLGLVACIGLCFCFCASLPWFVLCW